MMEILVPVSPGELLDKITILEIKSVRLSDPKKRRNVDREKEMLSSIARTHISADPEIDVWVARLGEVNGALWDVEDDLRTAEANRQFGDAFVRLARSVYRLNDERAALKRAINIKLGSTIIEEKSYVGSGHAGTRNR